MQSVKRTFLLLLTICFGLSGQAFAAVKVHHYRTQVPFILKVELNSLAKDQLPTPFTMTLADTVTKAEGKIPKGTVFKGTIVALKPSHRFDRPAYAVVQISELDPPDSAAILVPSNLQPTTRLLIQPGNNRAFQHFVVENLLLENASLAISGPLALFADADAGTFTVVDTAASVGIGALYGLYKKPQVLPLNADLTPHKAPKAHRFAYMVYAVYQSVTPIPPVWELFIKPKDFDYPAGTILSLPIKTSLFTTLFPLCSKTPVTTEVTPKG